MVLSTSPLLLGSCHECSVVNGGAGHAAGPGKQKRIITGALGMLQDAENGNE